MSNLCKEIKNFNKSQLKKSNIKVIYPNGESEYNQIDFNKGIIHGVDEFDTDNIFKIYGFIPLTKPDLQIGNIHSYLSFGTLNLKHFILHIVNLGSQDAASDWNEIQSNSITHIINLCSDFIPNYF